MPTRKRGRTGKLPQYPAIPRAKGRVVGGVDLHLYNLADSPDPTGLGKLPHSSPFLGASPGRPEPIRCRLCSATMQAAIELLRTQLGAVTVP